MSFDDPSIEWIYHSFHIFPYAKCVLLKFLQVTHGNLKLQEALRACCLQSVVSFQKLHYHVKIARKALRSHSSAGQTRREGLVIDVCGRASDCTADTQTTMSPLTDSAATAFPQQPQFASAEDELLPVIKRRKLAKQASETRAEAKLRSELNNQHFKNAFKEGTNLLLKRITNKDTATSSFSVDKIVADLNQKYNHVEGNKTLSKTTLYKAVRNGKVGESPMKRGPAPKISDILLDVTSLHAEVSQVGKGGELRGREIKKMLGADVPRH
jgi:hypothetical protein